MRYDHTAAATLCAALVCTSSVLAAQRPRQSSHDSTVVATIEHEWLGAQDSLTLGRILAGDFEHPVAQGIVLDKSAHIAWMVAHPTPPDRHPRFGSLGVRVYGDAAIALGSVVSTDDGGHEVARSLFTDVFIRRNGRWQAVSAQETAVTASPSAPTRPTTAPRSR